MNNQHIRVWCRAVVASETALFAVLLMVVGLCWAGPAQAGGCPVKLGKTYQAKFTDRGKYVKVDFSPNATFSHAAVFWQGDLNADKKQDMIVRYLNACDASYTCPFEIFAGCGNNRYRSMWRGRVSDMEVVKKRKKEKHPKNSKARIESNKWLVIKGITTTPHAEMSETLYFWKGRYKGD